jgi:hypothetical protein
MSSHSQVGNENLSLSLSVNERLIDDELEVEHVEQIRPPQLLPVVNERIVPRGGHVEVEVPGFQDPPPNPPTLPSSSNLNSSIPLQLHDNDDDDSSDEDSLYIPSTDGNPDEFDGDFVEYLPIEDITEEPIEDNEVEQIAFEESKMESPPSLLFPSSRSPSSPPSAPPRSNRGKPAVRFGFHTNIMKEVAKYGKEGEAALLDELKNMVEKGVFVPVYYEDLNEEERKNIIPSLAFIKQKFHADGSKDKVKVRVVAGGHKQDRTLFVNKNTSSPTLHLEHLFLEMGIALVRKRHRTSLDIRAAFLHVPVEEGEIGVFMWIEVKLAEILCEIDQTYCDFIQHNGKVLVRLSKSLYGCVKSALLWYKRLRATLEALGYRAGGEVHHHSIQITFRWQVDHAIHSRCFLRECCQCVLPL